MRCAQQPLWDILGDVLLWRSAGQDYALWSDIILEGFVGVFFLGGGITKFF